VRIKKRRCGIKSASKTATNSALVFGQSVIDVAGFGVGIVRTRKIANTLGFAEFFEPSSSTVVEHPHGEIWIFKAKRTGNGLFQNVQRLAKGWDVDVDARKLVRR
jgi:hypothetical protein